MHKSRILLVSMAVFLTFALLAHNLDASILNRRKLKSIGSSVVQISVYDWRGIYIRQGWGFFINEEGHIITPRHLLVGGFYVEATTTSRESYRVDKIYSEDVEGDLVRIGLEFAPISFRYIKDSAGIPELGERILVGGGTGMEPGAFLDGTIDDIREVPLFGYMMKVDSPYGISGSPVFNMRGDLVGIVLFRLEDGDRSAWAIPVGRIGKLMAKGGPPTNHLAWAERRQADWMNTSVGSYVTGLAHYWGKRYALALPNLQKANRDERFTRDVSLLLGKCNEALGRYHEAAKAYSAAVRLGTEDTDVYIALADSLLRDGNPRKALDACWTAIRFHPDSYEAFILLAKIYNALGSYKDALAGCYVARKMDSGREHAYYQQGVALKGMGNYEGAIDVFKMALHINPEMKKAYWDLALSYYQCGDKKSAAAICEVLRKIDPEMSNKLMAEGSK